MRLLITLWLFTALLLGSHAHAETPEEERLINATEILEKLVSIPEESIPPALLNSAYGVAVIPGVLKVGLVLGGRYGKGVLVVRQPDGQWSPPSFIRIAAGSVGWQAGAQSSDLILVFKNRRGVEGITAGKLTLGADASVAAGPVGRYTSASTDARLRSEVYSYSRSRGLFLGVALDGAAISIDQGANAAFYARPGVDADAIFDAADITVPFEARHFLATLTRLTPEQPLTVPPPPRSGSTAPVPGERPGSGDEPEVRTYGIGEGDGTRDIAEDRDDSVDPFGPDGDER
ncbi:MAG: lipid-binding SYLF domain-containing protein [Gammaproteobacteria bacterium]